MPYSRKTLSAGTLRTFKVENKVRESLGTIKDLMIELATGKVAYAILSYGGVLGMGEKLFAISWSKLEPDPDKDQVFILDMPKEKLDEARGFNPEQWPDEVDPNWPLQM
jgi:hypothetical protein